MANGERSRVLVVDDDEVDALRLERALESIGCVVQIESDPLNLAAEVRNFNPDLVVMDIHMPGLRGDHAARVLPLVANAMHVPTIPVLLVSGEDPARLQELAHLIGAHGKVPKNAPIEEFLAQVLAILGHRRVA